MSKRAQSEIHQKCQLQGERIASSPNTSFEKAQSMKFEPHPSLRSASSQREMRIGTGEVNPGQHVRINSSRMVELDNARVNRADQKVLV